jgi:hypothetical protein
VCPFEESEGVGMEEFSVASTDIGGGGSGLCDSWATGMLTEGVASSSLLLI